MRRLLDSIEHLPERDKAEVKVLGGEPAMAERTLTGEQRIPDEMLVARIQAVAHTWGLAARLVSSDDDVIPLEIGMAGQRGTPVGPA